MLLSISTFFLSAVTSFPGLFFREEHFVWPSCLADIPLEALFIILCMPCQLQLQHYMFFSLFFNLSKKFIVLLKLYDFLNFLCFVSFIFFVLFSFLLYYQIVSCICHVPVLCNGCCKLHSRIFCHGYKNK